MKLPDMQTPRRDAVVVRLRDGRVLVAGGYISSDSITSTAKSELFDPSTRTWVAAGDMIAARNRPATALLADGRVLVVGGAGSASATGEVFDPSSGLWRRIANPPQPSYGAALVVLSDSTAMLIGGDSGGIVDTVYLFDPATETWRLGVPLPAPVL
jgi:hypothetical protein